jgi:uncharacterized protein YbjT (DUF2867 family)/lipocalin
MTARVLLTGASGYIGSRLLGQLEERGCTVRCLARQPARVAASRGTTEVVAGDCLDRASLDTAMKGVDQAFYLVHSMASGAGFAELDRRAAANFARAARRAGVRRLIYLGGLADSADSLSTHLKSRVETGEALRDSGVPVVEFRASIVIGAGSLSFEMIRALVERLPAMLCPRWVDTRTQPIAIDDVLAYLRAALDLPEGRHGVFEIGGPEVVSYGDMMREYARLRGLRRVLIPVPVLTPRLSGLWLGLVTPAQSRVGRALVESLRNSTVVRSSAAIDTFAIHPTTLGEAFVRAIGEGSGAQVKTDSRLAGGGLIDGWRVEAYEPDRLLRRIAQRAARETARRPADGGGAASTDVGRSRPGVVRRWAAAFVLVGAATLQPAAAPAQTPPVRAVGFVDLARYAGDWFEIARFPNRFQGRCLGDVRATYTRRPDGRLDVVNRCRTAEGETEARGVARIVDGRTFATLKVRFAPAWLSWLPMVWGDYWIVGLAPDYSWAVVGEPGRDYLWILARAPHLDDESTALARAAARDNGFDVERLVPTPQAEVGRP